MAASNTIVVADGHMARGAFLRFDADGTASFLTGTIIGATVATSLDGVAVDASTAETYTSAAALTPIELVKAFVADMDSKVTGCSVSWSQIEDDQFIVKFTPIPRVADDVQLSVPVITPGV